MLYELKRLIPEPRETEEKENFTGEDGVPLNPADDLFAPYEKITEETPEPILIDGSYYCGIVTIPALDIELPVADSWSYSALTVSPCRYSGSVDGGDLIIAAHNFGSHFGRIGELNSRDEIIFTDTNGTDHRFEVVFTEYIDGYDVEEMFGGNSEEWDITIFTCTLSGKSRVAVRGCEG